MKNSQFMVLGSERKSIYFYRDYRDFRGGHLKVWHYYVHTKMSGQYNSSIYLTPSSCSDRGNPWRHECCLLDWNPEKADVLFLAGLDWQAVHSHCSVPVINLIQGFRHAEPSDPRFQFLSRPAIRICVSMAVADAIHATGCVNGPVHVIPNGLPLSEFPPAAAQRDIPLLLMGQKDPALASRLSDRMNQQGVEHVLHLKMLPRPQFLDYLRRSVIVVLLPLASEGFYLPALEAMAMGCVVICPDCIGNRHFCIDRVTCLRPERTLHALADSVNEAHALSESDRLRMLRAGAVQVGLHDLGRERDAYLSILGALPCGNF